MTAAVRSVTGPDGVAVAYRVWGDAADRPTLLLIHGWAQNGGSWGADLLADLATRHRVIAVDLRGHGASGMPVTSDDPGDGFSADLLVGDVEAVLAAEAGDDGVVAVGWSYGGLVICDLLASRAAGVTDGPPIAGVGLVGAITSLGRGERGGRVGTAMRAALPDAYSEDPRTAIRALSSFGAALVPADRPDLGTISQYFFGASLSTRPAARAGLFARTASHDDMLPTLAMPVLVLHGTDDTVVDVSAAHHAAGLLSGDVDVDLWEGAGHAPFVEDPARFAAALDRLVERAVSVASAAGGAR
ncbi:Pimeloyl-ACP methyl ester carboxylesterase [Williamsia serinedens]|uniref:Pimeloyl-ACP methyl ester carboxylesterase n=1 Tax=Williamsia serinedens TaxID=391736 RepID=A0ABT1H3K5_9NOCA|nr:Pimeloyl-ACP methyl ester carboxylesterase [Williamsia serinedens]